MIDRLAHNRLVLIHGVAGSGKSSLVRAGILPKLALQYSRHGAPWLTCAMRPSGGPLWNLAREFAGLERRGEDLERVSAIAGQFNARSATLASVAASLEGVGGGAKSISANSAPAHWNAPEQCPLNNGSNSRWPDLRRCARAACVST